MTTTTDSLRPVNIVLVMADQLSALATSPYGNADVLTPNMDALASRGTLFERTYCNAPLCAPSRASMMTGMLPGRIPVDDNFEELPAGIPTFAHHLRRRGYQTILSGKMHFVGPDQLHGFEERLTTDIYPSDFLGAQDWETLGDPPRPPAVRQGRPMARMVPEAGPVKWSTQLDYDEEVHFRACERLRQLARREDESRPWFLCVSYTQPHDPYAPAQEYWDRYEGRELAPPAEGPEGWKPTVWDQWVNSYQGVEMVDTSPEAVRRLRRAYYAMVSYIDDKLGELVWELERLGQLENTVVVLTSDHGDMLGEHGMFFKRTFREWSTRVPLILAGPGIPSAQRVETHASLVDLFPTMVALADAKDDYGEDQNVPARPGRDLFDPNTTPEPVIIDYSANGVIAPTRTVVSGSMKYVYVHGREELLFDLEQDPDEWCDVSTDPDYSESLTSLRTACMTDWDPAAAHERTLKSQRRRAFLGQALATGRVRDWDFQPFFDAARQHMRRPAGPIWDFSYTDQANPSLGGG
ncbi:choline-sulfatase [Tessaracoccus sp. OS52]|uniref:choline-sulfatase n=1 Tax=Tessaracoccus sp. OS52 TaxID=2886691 RepID=UPI00351D1E74